jgi:hypothetical protein
VAGSCENGNEHLGSMKRWEFQEWLSNCWLLEKASSTPWSLLVGYLVMVYLTTPLISIANVVKL